jgi:hypothetical protein
MNQMTLEFLVRWYCRICWKQGLTSVTILPIKSRLVPPTKEELLTMVRVAILNPCCASPDIRVHEEEKKIKVNVKRRKAEAN